ncbi:hypothetical protein [uncultured Luteimonas sp.]|uniref:hypothetical protein n=1 Tax=uncultured Luteimonas sp. TaxID=453144 RepID=UPI002607AB38|nr:hypothetical protein [uncultured Luteimonas sp.]
MIQQLNVEDLVLLCEAMHALGNADNHTGNLVAKESQNGSQARMLIVLGDRRRHIDELRFRLRERLSQLTGMPEIQHGNADVRSESTLYPLTRQQEAQEANLRG